MPHMAQLADFRHYQVHAAIPVVRAAHALKARAGPVCAWVCGFARAIAVSDGLCDARLCASRSGCDRLGVLPVFGPAVCV